MAQEPAIFPTMSRNKQGLIEQDLSTLNPAKLTPLSPEVISRQATINIGGWMHCASGSPCFMMPGALRRPPSLSSPLCAKRLDGSRHLGPDAATLPPPL